LPLIDDDGLNLALPFLKLGNLHGLGHNGLNHRQKVQNLAAEYIGIFQIFCLEFLERACLRTREFFFAFLSVSPVEVGVSLIFKNLNILVFECKQIGSNVFSGWDALTYS
jgi:hypothetical protein